MSELRNDRSYSKTHEWLLVKENYAEIGITDYAQNELGDLVYAEAEPAGSVLETGDLIGSIESVKMAADLYSPVDGEIVEANTAIEDEPELINQSPYEAWIVRIKLTNPEQVNELLSAKEYDEFCRGGGK